MLIPQVCMTLEQLGTLEVLAAAAAAAAAWS